MDNETKISNEQINCIMQDFDSLEKKDGESISEIINKHLTQQQSQSVQNMLNDPEKLKKLLSSPFAKVLMEKFVKNGE